MDDVGQQVAEFRTRPPKHRTPSRQAPGRYGRTDFKIPESRLQGIVTASFSFARSAPPATAVDLAIVRSTAYGLYDIVGVAVWSVESRLGAQTSRLESRNLDLGGWRPSPTRSSRFSLCAVVPIKFEAAVVTRDTTQLLIGPLSLSFPASSAVYRHHSTAIMELPYPAVLSLHSFLAPFRGVLAWPSSTVLGKTRQTLIHSSKERRNDRK